MTVYNSAGVYVKETDLSQVVATTSTSIGAIVGEFLRGPINTPVFTQNTKNFIDTFGKPDPVNLTWPSAYCALAFHERSSQLFTVRAVNSDNSHRYAGIKVENNNGEVAYSTTLSGLADPDTVALTTAQPFYAYAIGPGTYANDNLGISISSSNVYTPPVEIPAADLSVVVETTLGTGVWIPGDVGVLLSYKVTKVTLDGETDVSAAATFTIAAATNTASITIAQQDGAIAYKIYRNSGASLTTWLLRATVNATGDDVTYSDIGTAAAGVITVATAASEVVAVALPSTVVPAVIVGGGSLPAAPGGYSYRVSVVVGDEETSAGTAVVSAAVALNDQVSITIPHVRGAKGYNIYGRVAGSELFIAYIQASTTGASVVYTDTGAITPAGALPDTDGVWAAAGAKYYRCTVISDAGETQPNIALTLTTTNVNQHVIVAIPRQANASAYRIYRADTSGNEQLITSITQSTEEGDGFVTYVDVGTALDADAAFARDITTDGKTPEFKVKVFSYEVSTSVEVEAFDVSLADRLDGFGVQMQIEDKINTQSRYIRVYKNPAYTGVDYFFDDAGGVNYFENGVDGTAPTSSDISLAWDNYADKEKITVRLLINGGVTSVTVQQKMNSIAMRRGDCVAILDMPTQYQSETGLSEVNYRRSILNLNTNRAAIYSPDLYINDPYNDKLLYVPPSGHIAGVYANTDYVAQAWFAPAGLNRGLLSIQGLRYKYNQEARDTLAPAQVNYMRNFPGQGIAVWEALTLQAKTSALSFVNVRRLLDVIEISVSEALLYSVWEPNDDFLRRQIVGMITEFLEVIRIRRGLLEYAVISDSTNNPPSVYSVGQLNVDVYVIPTLPAQKIQLGITILKSGASFQELIAAGGVNL